MVRRCLSWVVPVAALVAMTGCSEEGPVAPVGPESPGASDLLACEVDLKAGSLSCAGGDADLGEGALGAIIGGQGIFLQLISNNVGYDETAETFSASVSIKNLSDQVLGSADGITADPTGIRVFFVNSPSAEGTGSVTVANPDGVDDFSGSGQPYYEYQQALRPGQTSLPRTWEWGVPPTVTKFSFLVGVSTEVADEDGLTPGPDFLARPIAADSQHSCVIDLNGQAWCWGRAGNGKLGQGAALAQNLPVPQKVQQGDLRFVSITAGINHTCALDISGDAYCWGSPSQGRLGNGTTSGIKTTPSLVLGGHKFIQITAGRRFTCGLTVDNDALCWGNNSHGELGNGLGSSSDMPTPVAGGHKFASLGAGKVFACGVTLAGDAWCWGAGTVGRLGNGEEVDQSTPVAVVGGHKFVKVTGGNNHTCALTPDGEAWCWGSGANGKLGALDEYGSPVGGGNPVPHRVATDLKFVDIDLGQHHTCALSTEGKAYCWGHRAKGKVGDGNTAAANISTPFEVLGDHRFVALDVGTEHACGLKADGEVWCWGGRDWGQLGDGEVEDTGIGVPVKVLPRGG